MKRWFNKRPEIDVIQWLDTIQDELDWLEQRVTKLEHQPISAKLTIISKET